MGFNSVYKALQDVFPQIDSRILRAVAIEHKKDADVAVEVVLVEVIPRMSEQSHKISSSIGSESSINLAEVGGKTVQHEATLDHVDGISSFSELSTKAASSISDGSLPGAIEEPIASGSLGISSYHDAIGETDPVSDKNYQICEEIRHENGASLGESVRVSESIQEEADLQLDVSTPATNDKYIHLTVDSEMSEKDVDFTQESDLVNSKTSENSEDESLMTSMLTRSEQNCSTELLEEIIEDARNSKKTFVSTMDSVVNLMREVESKEKAAEQAKEEATRDCFDILEKVDELKETLRRAKEANDMHAGEVYAEKAILATELKELQLRLFTLSDERNKSLEILDQMRRGLEVRMATALKEIEAAEEEKMKKEKSAREALAYQESQMEKVVEESKKLKLVAEENSKLQEFLMDRGRAIDMLQGEISVKCQDVRVLKEKFVKGIPLSRSLSSSYTSSFLASSSSSFRSAATRSEPEPETFGTPNASAEVVDSFGLVSQTKTINSVDDSFPSGGEKQEDDRKLPLDDDDDDWELFEKDDLRLDA